MEPIRQSLNRSHQFLFRQTHTSHLEIEMDDVVIAINAVTFFASAQRNFRNKIAEILFNPRTQHACKARLRRGLGTSQKLTSSGALDESAVQRTETLRDTARVCDKRRGGNPMQFIDAGLAFLTFLVILWLLLDDQCGR